MIETRYGIDQIAFYTPSHMLELASLAKYHNLAEDYYYKQIGQKFMAITSPGEDCITLAANAAEIALSNVNRDDIELLLFATESSVDQSKAAALPLHGLLKLQSNCRCLELKQACYSGTAGLQLALSWLRDNPGKKALLIVSDIAHYELNSPAEASQGAGAVAMVLSANPRLLSIEKKSGYSCEDVADFWRPNYKSQAIVDGRKSCSSYMKLLRNSWQHYKEQTQYGFKEHHKFCFHIPFPKLVETAMHKLALIEKEPDINAYKVQQWLGGALDYSRQTGNCYTASLYISIISLLENNPDNLAGKRIGLYSYGSGAVGEYFSAVVQNNYKKFLYKNYHNDLLSRRISIDINQYHKMKQFAYVVDGSEQNMLQPLGSRFGVQKIKSHYRCYKDYHSKVESLEVMSHTEKV